MIVGRVDGFEGEVRLTAVSKKSWFVHQRFRWHGSHDGPGPVRVIDVPPREQLVLEARDGHGRSGLLEVRAAEPGATLDFGTLVPTETAAHVMSSVRDDGAFSLSSPHVGPWTLRLLTLVVEGEVPDVHAVSGVDEVRDAHPGVPVEFLRR